MNLGLALSGGGVKGAAHIGVLQALTEAGVRPCCITGSSAGSIVAALYAAGYTPEEIRRIFLLYVPVGNRRYGYRTVADTDLGGIVQLMTALLSGGCRFRGFVKGERLCGDMAAYLRAKNIRTMADFKLPIAIPALDLCSGALYYFSNTAFCDRVISDIPPWTAVRASCAFPVVFRPVRFRDKLFVDGGITDNTPVEYLRGMGSDFNMAVRFKECPCGAGGCGGILQIADRSVTLMRTRLEAYTDTDIDLPLDVDTGDASLLDTAKIPHCLKAGYDACLQCLPQLCARIPQSQVNEVNSKLYERL